MIVLANDRIISVLEKLVVIYFGDTGYRFRKYQRRHIFKELGKFEGEIEDSKNIYEISNSKKSYSAAQVFL